jgi:hypothetical protein
MIELMINRKRLKGYSIAKEDMKCGGCNKKIPKGSFYEKGNKRCGPSHPLQLFTDYYNHDCCILWPGLHQETFKIG